MSTKLALSALRAAAVIGGFLVVALLDACGGTSPPPENTVVPTPTVQSAVPLDRFHYVASVILEEQRREPGGNKLEVRTEGDFQAPDRHSLTYTERFGDLSFVRSLVLIGDEAWFRENDGAWQPVTLADPRVAAVLSTAFTAIRPNFLGGPAFDQARASIKRLYSTEEEVNGLATNHYVVGDPGREYFSELLADQDFLQKVRDLNWGLWLAIDGDWPVRLQANATVTSDLQLLQDLNLTAPTSWTLSVDISRPNDPALTIAPPTG
jgi:hypothetical protein